MGNEYSQELIDLAFAALDHGIDSVREGGSLIPFVMTESDEGRTLDRFASDLLEDAVAQAIASSKHREVSRAPATSWPMTATSRSRPASGSMPSTRKGSKPEPRS